MYEVEQEPKVRKLLKSHLIYWRANSQVYIRLGACLSDEKTVGIDRHLRIVLARQRPGDVVVDAVERE